MIMQNLSNEKKYDGYVLPITVFLGLLIPFFVPNAISALIKPLGIVACICFFVASKQNVLKGVEQYLFFIFFSMYLCACCRYNENLSLGSIGYLLYIIYSALYVTVDHTIDSVGRTIKACFWSGSLFALFVAISNPFFVYNVYTRTTFWVLWQEINSNQIVYFIAMGLAAFPFLIKNKSTSKLKKCAYILFLVIMVYAILLTLSRGGFLCLVGILIVFILDLEMSYMKSNVLKNILSFFVVMGIVYLLFKNLPFNQMSRILSADSYADSNGRSIMFSEALSSINNIFIGDGCDAWTGSHKMHNIFISIFVQTGVLGLISFVSLLLYEFLNVRTIAPLYFLIPLMIESMVESGDAYTFWVPLIMISLLNKKRIVYV